MSRALRFICDTGAQCNLVSENVIQELNIIRQSTRVNIKGINGTEAKLKGEVVLKLCHHHNTNSIEEAKFAIVKNLRMHQPPSAFEMLLFPGISATELADPKYNVPSSIDGIIGAGIIARHTRERIKRHSSGLLAQDTSFGWIVFGENPIATNSSDAITIGLVSTAEMDIVKKLWEIEDLPEKKQQSQEEKDCEWNYESTVVRLDGRYNVTLPLKPDSQLGESRAMALRRLYCLENRFKRNPALKEAYIKFMTEYEDLGHMHKAPKLRPGEDHYYIPHHAVAIERKFRVVFDGSAKTSNGRSLNDVQFIGPRLQKDLLDIVMNFRTGRYALTADICKMFRQIGIQSSQWNYQRILWRTDANEPILDYWLAVVTYGLASSPYNAVKTLIQCAIDHGEGFPRAAQVVLNDFYVDDMLTSVESEPELRLLKGEVIALLQKGGFVLAKWRSNCESMMEKEARG